MKDKLYSPQVIAAIITGVITIMVALVPIYLNRSSTQPDPVPIVTAIPVATDVPAASPIVEASDSPTLVVDTATPVPATDAPDANLLLLYDDVSFTVYNQGSQTLSLSNLGFQSASSRWDASAWGTGLTDRFFADNCLRLRDVSSGQRQPPAICGNLLGLQLVAESALFWIGSDAFEVLQDGRLVATCSSTSEECAIFIP